MREIKFRAWDAKNKEIYYPTAIGPSRFALDNNEYYCALACDYGYEIGESLPDTLMQYTGLKDKNGKEIYEGDLLQKCKTDMMWVVYWDEVFAAILVYQNGHKTEGVYGIWPLARDCQVIGNIYENPELLEKPDNSEGKL